MKKKTTQTYQFLLRLESAAGIDVQAGIDVHKDFFQVAICRKKDTPIEMRFGTFTSDLYLLRDF